MYLNVSRAMPGDFQPDWELAFIQTTSKNIARQKKNDSVRGLREQYTPLYGEFNGVLYEVVVQRAPEAVQKRHALEQLDRKIKRAQDDAQGSATIARKANEEARLAGLQVIELLRERDALLNP